MLQFSCRSAFTNFWPFKPDNENDANFDALQANAPTLISWHLGHNIWHIICRHLNIMYSSMNYC